jgi:rhodanese-related sulfurtransferase
MNINERLKEARIAVPQLLPDAAARATQDGALIIDIRTPIERQIEGVIPGSLHLPRTVLEWCVDPASGYSNPAISGPNHALILMCNEGYSSCLAAQSLQQLGFTNVANLAGGYRGWKAYGLPTQPPIRPPHDELNGRNPPEPPAPILVRKPPLRYWLYRLFLRLFA